jgi:hypothetical protein
MAPASPPGTAAAAVSVPRLVYGWQRNASVRRQNLCPNIGPLSGQPHQHSTTHDQRAFHPVRRRGFHGSRYERHSLPYAMRNTPQSTFIENRTGPGNLGELWHGLG